MPGSRLLKKDLFGEVRVDFTEDSSIIVRDASRARIGLRWLARRLLRREAQVLLALAELDGVPDLLGFDNNRLMRRYLDGRPMHEARPGDPGYFRAAARLLRAIHRAGVVHNDLAKEPNLLVTAEGTAAFLDFQLAWKSSRRGRLFCVLAYEDIRHLLKHKRTYCADALTARERTILEKPAWPSRFWMSSVKPIYLFVTRRVLGWADREGAADRGSRF